MASLGFRGSGFRVWGLGFRVCGFKVCFPFLFRISKVLTGLGLGSGALGFGESFRNNKSWGASGL